MAEPTTLYLLRHGEIDRPPVAQFYQAVLTVAGRQQIHTLALRWPHRIPEIIYCSPLARSVETASILASVFRRPIRTVDGLQEWAATEADVPQYVYRDLERRSWADFDFRNDDGESLNHAGDRIEGFLESMARDHRGRAAMVSGHSILFALFVARIRRERATEAAKNGIGFGHYAIVSFDGHFRLERDFGP